MPVDELGNRADLITDSVSATTSRMNFGRIYEGYMGACARDNRDRLIKYFTEKYGNQYLFKLKKEDIDYVIDYVRGLYSLINLEMVEFIDSLDEEGREEHAMECLEEWIYFYYPPNNGFRIVDVIDAIENSPYKPHFGKVKYIDDLGREVITDSNIRMNRAYFMLLDRTGRDFSGVASAKVNSFLLPIKGGEYDKHSYPHSQTPVTNLSETEMRIMMSYAGPKTMAELVDLTLNPVTHEAVNRNFLENPKLFDMNFDIDRNVIPYGNNKPLIVAKHIMRGAGLKFNYVRDPENNN